MRDLFHETYDLLMGPASDRGICNTATVVIHLILPGAAGIQPWPASMDGLLLALHLGKVRNVNTGESFTGER